MKTRLNSLEKLVFFVLFCLFFFLMANQLKLPAHYGRQKWREQDLKDLFQFYTQVTLLVPKCFNSNIRKETGNQSSCIWGRKQY